MTQEKKARTKDDQPNTVKEKEHETQLRDKCKWTGNMKKVQLHNE